MSIDWNWGIFLQQAPFGNTTYLGWIWSGFQVTIALSICAWIIAFLVGSFFGILRTVPNRFLSGLGTLYVELFRNVPLIVQFFTWYLVIPELLPEKIGMWFKAELDPNIQFFLSSMLCLGLFSGCGSDVYIAKLALSGTAGTFDPQFAENQNSILVASNVFEGLLVEDPDGGLHRCGGRLYRVFGRAHLSLPAPGGRLLVGRQRCHRR